MHLLTAATKALNLLPFLSTLSLALPSSPSPLSPRTCGTILPPSNFYQISQGPAVLRNNTGDRGPFFNPYAPPGQQTTFSFFVAEYANSDEKQDLIASFKNVSCPPAGRGPYSIQFAFNGTSGATTTGNTKINVFAITGNLPTETVNGVTSEVPTWDNIAAQTGSLIGTFTFPASGAASTVIFINSVTCTPTINLRFSIADPNGNTPADDGTVTYAQDGAQGLQIQYGC